MILKAGPLKTGMVSLNLIKLFETGYFFTPALKTWKSAMEDSLSKDIDLNGITGFCVRQSYNNPDKQYLYLRINNFAANGCSNSVVSNIILFHRSRHVY